MSEMTSHERFRRMYEHLPADRVPIIDSPWGATIERWRREGMPRDVSWVDYFGADHTVGIRLDNSPRYEEKVLEQTDEYKLVIEALFETNVPMPVVTFDEQIIVPYVIPGQTTQMEMTLTNHGFVHGDGTPIRFWAAGERTQPNPSLDALKRQARFLAKRGVNALRIFAMIPPKGPNSRFTDVDEKELDCVFKIVAAMKSAGIYTIIDGYWASATKTQKGWDVTSPGRDNPEGLLFFDPKFQVGYKAWMKALYNRPNPHTGVRLADEPAVAIIQLQNEDSLLWWGVAEVRRVPGEKARLAREGPSRLAELQERVHGR